MKVTKVFAVLLVSALLFTACGKTPAPSAIDSAIQIVLSDKGVTVNGDTAAVHTAHDIVYYEEGKDFTYGEGTENDAHSKAEADLHTVVHITKAGTYALSGKLSHGQIAVDLGKDAKKDPEAVVTLVLNGVDITCTVAPAVIFYNVYECGSKHTETATKDVDTSAAGANVMIADDTVNTVNGAYVARIYEPETVVLDESKTKVEDADKLHKYDGAFYSKMSMNIGGGSKSNGVLNINAENEGLGTELHLTVNGGIINIRSGNDGINTNEDEVSVTTVNSGTLDITVTGETGEGDGIDSNGWLVINGGKVTALACSSSADSGIDSDRGIHITGGTVLATGSMLDRLESGGQTYAVFNFAQKQNGGAAVTLKNKQNKPLLDYTPENAYSVLVYSSPALTEGTYTLWCGGKQMAGDSGGMGGGFGRPGMNGDGTPPERPENSGKFERPEKPNDQGRQPQTPNNQTAQTTSKDFVIVSGANMFSGVTYAK